jgi:hypothetical protein
MLLVVALKQCENYLLSLNHSAGLVLTTPALSKHSINLINEDDARLEFTSQGEHCANEFVRVTVPLFSQSRDVQIDEACATLVSQRLCKHGLPAPGRAVE